MTSKRETAEESVLSAIRSFDDRPFGPSRRDLARITGLGTGTCQEIVVNLAQRGLITWTPLVARSIRLIEEKEEQNVISK